MDCAIFLLALCVFKTVFGDEQFREKLEKLRDTSRKHMQETVLSLRDQIEAAIEAGLNMEMERECWKDYWILFDFYNRNNRFGIYDHCFSKALAETDMKFAEECFAENIKLLEEKEQESRFNTRECIAKCYRRAGREQHPAIQL